VLAESSDGILGYRCPRKEILILSIHDREYRSDATMNYRLHLGAIPVITAIHPLGLQRTTEQEVRVEGVYLDGVKSVRVKAPGEAAIGSKLPVVVKTARGAALGGRSVVVGEFGEMTANPEGIPPSGTVASVPVPGTANGQLTLERPANTWSFQARKGERLIVEVEARRLGSALDSYLEILDARGQPVPRASLRCLARTYTTFRDHDSASTGIRIESWNELAINDYLYVGSELVRIRALPKNPDDDCQFFSVAGQRVGYLDTTPTHHPQGETMYRVEIHPPGTVFPANGFPVFAIPYRNDDGGPGHGKDSRLYFDPPADGEYQVRVGDSRGADLLPSGGEAGSRLGLAYRLTIRPPRPGYTVSFSPTAPAVWKGGALPITVTADRSDGFDDAIQVRLENLPPGFHAPITTIPAGETSTVLALFAEATATVPASAPPLRLVATATIGTQEVRREVAGSQVKAVDPGDIVTTTRQAEVTLKPGGQVRLTATIERRNDFKGRVPLDVRGLPHGVRVLDIGLNGILITEKETTRTFVLYAEPWVQPQEHPFVVLARSEGKKTEHAARSVLLKVVGPGQP
jgi:hypothetical protein